MFKCSQLAVAASRVCARTNIVASVRTVPVLSSKLSQFRHVNTPSPLRFNSALRFYASGRASLDLPAKDASYEDVKAISSKPNSDVVIVDVREPGEFEDGHIPNAINIPFKTMPGALGLDEAEFESHFGFPKPDFDKTLLFYCKGGVRSTGSEQLAHTFGYNNRINYKGSYDDWVAHEKGDAPESASEPASKL